MGRELEVVQGLSSLRDSDVKNWIALVLSSGALAGVIAYAADYGSMSSAVANHIADPSVHGNAEATEQKIDSVGDELHEHKRNFDQFRTEQNSVNQRVLQSLGAIERELLIERDRR